MTERKPAEVSVPAWVERQIRAAEQSGAFDDLPGKGRPIPDLGRTHDDMAWLASYLRRENVDVAELLPPALALAKEVEQLPDRMARERSEERVRRHVEGLNARIRAAHARPQIGPPVRVRPVDVETTVQQWRAARPAPAPTAAPTPEPEPASGRRRWFRRRTG